MFADWVKIAAKAVALGLAAALVIGFMANFTIPNFDISFITTYMNKAYTVGLHYIPYFGTLWTLGVSLLTLELIALGVKFALITAKWVLKVNE